jgi:hypothetical protein
MWGTRTILNPSIVSQTWKDAKKCLLSNLVRTCPRDVITCPCDVIAYNYDVLYTNEWRHNARSFVWILIINEVVDIHHLKLHHLTLHHTPPHSTTLHHTPPHSTTLHHKNKGRTASILLLTHHFLFAVPSKIYSCYRNFTDKTLKLHFLSIVI